MRFLTMKNSTFAQNGKIYSALHDVFAQNKETGEAMPCQQVIHLYYTEWGHKYPDCWIDEWDITDVEVPDSYIDFPCFA